MVETYKKSILAGIAISLGCIIYLSVDNKYIGAFLFSLGLITICSRGWALFTGKLCTVTLDSNSLIEIVVVWLGNLTGALGTVLISSGFIKPEMTELIVNNKINTLPIVLFAKAIFCEFCIYIAVVGYKKIESDLGKYLSIILGIMVFILSGFEHCVADMFYILSNTIANPTIIGFMVLMVVTFGNVFGALILRILDN